MDFENMELKSRIEAMTPEEVKIILSVLPAEPMIDELKSRFIKNKEQLENIRSIAING